MLTVDFIRRNALGLIAIFIALSGTAVATQVNKTTKVVQAEPAKKPKGKPGPRGPAGPAGAQGPAGLQGQSGLTGTIGRHSGTGSCSDDDQNGDECTTVNLTLPQAGRVLLVATANSRTTAFDDLFGVGSGSDSTTFAGGVCVLTADGLEVSNTEQSVGETQGGTGTEPSWTGLGTGTAATTGVTDSLSAGSHAFTLRCTEIDADVDWSGVRLSAVSLGSG